MHERYPVPVVIHDLSRYTRRPGGAFTVRSRYVSASSWRISRQLAATPAVATLHAIQGSGGEYRHTPMIKNDGSVRLGRYVGLQGLAARSAATCAFVCGHSSTICYTRGLGCWWRETAVRMSGGAQARGRPRLRRSPGVGEPGRWLLARSVPTVQAGGPRAEAHQLPSDL